MPKKVTEYRCLLISPGDVALEREALSAYMAKWNGQIGVGLGVRVELVRWETHSRPDLSGPAQSILNEQIVEDCDLGIAIFWTRLGTKTAEHASGSLEEIHKLLEKGCKVLAYFKTAPLVQGFDTKQHANLLKAKEELRSRGLAGEFEDIEALKESVSLHLTSTIATMLAQDRLPEVATPPASATVLQKPDVRVRVSAGITRRDVYEPTLIISAENHSPVVVYMGSISIGLNSNEVLHIPIDSVTGDWQRRKVLNPGESAHLYMTKSSLARVDKGWKSMKYAFCKDDINRIYESSQDEFSRAIDQVMNSK